MKPFKNAILIFLILNTFKSMSQNITSHQWENRVLLILTNSIENSVFQNQIKELKTHKNGLTDRKLIVYQTTKAAYKKGLNNEVWKEASNLYEKYNPKQATFKIVLIGLDGGEKLEQSEFLSCEDLFKIIDVMPMRKSELKRKKTGFKN